MKEQRVVPALHLLEYIRDTCPSLKVLGIDENRTDDQENEKAIANVLCSFKQLDTIQLWPDLGVARYKKHYNSRRKRAFGADDEDSLKSEEEIKLFPDVDEEFVKRIWNYLQEKKEGKRLKKLLVKVGEWQGPIHGYPVRWVSWACSSKKSWILKQKERDDQVGECEISSTNHDYQEELYGES